MKAVSVNEFYTNFQKYLNAILRGENIVLSRNKKRIALIEPIKEKTKRPFGLCKGEFVIPYNFNEPLPDTVIAPFHN